jgi:serine/threonine protein kinase
MAELPLVGEEFAGYRLTSVIGRGGMSIVFRAENPRLGNVIALKVLDPSLAGTTFSAPGSSRNPGSPPR